VATDEGTFVSQITIPSPLQLCPFLEGVLSALTPQLAPSSNTCQSVEQGMTWAQFVSAASYCIDAPTLLFRQKRKLASSFGSISDNANSLGVAGIAYAGSRSGEQ
jgi:hypothetical protein